MADIEVDRDWAEHRPEPRPLTHEELDAQEMEDALEDRRREIAREWDE